MKNLLLDVAVFPYVILEVFVYIIIGIAVAAIAGLAAFFIIRIIRKNKKKDKSDNKE